MKVSSALSSRSTCLKAKNYDRLSYTDSTRKLLAPPSQACSTLHYEIKGQEGLSRGHKRIAPEGHHPHFKDQSLSQPPPAPKTGYLHQPQKLWWLWVLNPFCATGPLPVWWKLWASLENTFKRGKQNTESHKENQLYSVYRFKGHRSKVSQAHLATVKMKRADSDGYRGFKREMTLRGGSLGT